MYTNPVFPSYFADPFVFRHDGVYYAVGTGAFDAGLPGIFTVLRSPDLCTWEAAGTAMPALDPAFGDSYWAPEVAIAEGRFWMYYSVGRGDKAHHLRVAVADQPEGPYADTGTRLTNPFETPFAIDASPFRDDDGQWYLFWAEDFLDERDGARAGTALVMDRLASMTQLAGEKRVVLRARHDWQRFLQDRVMYGARYDWHTLEGPSVLKRAGRYWCFFSAGRWEDETYGVDYAVADAVTGPYTDAGNDAGPRVLRTVPGVALGPGHNSFAVSPAGTDYIVYHAWDTAMTGRRMFLDPIDWTADGPRCAGPTVTPQRLR